MNDSALPDDLDALVEGWLDGTLDAALERRLGDLVARDPRAAARLARGVLVHDRLRDILRSGTVPGRGVASEPRPAPRRAALVRVAIPLVLAAALLMPVVVVRSAPASAALDRVARASAIGDREYVVRVVDHGPGGPRVVDADSGGRKPGVDGARLFVRGGDRFVLERFFGDGTRFVNGSDGAVGWSVPPTGHVHLSRDVRRFRRGVPGEDLDVPFIALPENLRRLGRGYGLHLVAPGGDGTRVLVADRLDRRRRGPARVTIRFDADGTPVRIDLQGLRAGLEWADHPAEAADGPDHVSLELVSRADLDADFFDHTFHHAPHRPCDWE